jgi:histidyl-tRNA synthetase
MKIQKCKGMSDLSPADMKAFRAAEGICRACFQQWGYNEVRTPTIEHLHLFTSAGTLTPGMLGKVYSFLDWDGWSGERVVLRPDGTIPVARYYTESIQRGPARLFYTENIFRFEESGEKNRERWQCGAELIGAGSALADAELVALSLDILEKLGIKNIELRLSHAGLLKALLGKLGMEAEEQHKTLDKILDGDTETLEKIRQRLPGAEDNIRPLLSLAGQSTGFLRNQKAILAKSLPEINAPLDDFLKTVAVLDNLGINYKINIASGTGFEYYTGLIFQMFIGKEKVGGGGRYDDLITAMGGGDVPASGFALYLDKLMNYVKPEVVKAIESIRITIRPTGGFINEAFKAAAELRHAGYTVAIDPGEKGAEWTIEAGNKAPAFTIKNNISKKFFEAATITEVIKILTKS